MPRKFRPKFHPIFRPILRPAFRAGIFNRQESGAEQHPKIAIPIALYRPEIGRPARNGEKKAEKWILAPPGKREKKGRKMGKWPFLTHCWATFPFFRPFFSHFGPVEPKSIFRPFFSHFGPEARFRICTEQSGSQPKDRVSKGWNSEARDSKNGQMQGTLDSDIPWASSEVQPSRVLGA